MFSCRHFLDLTRLIVYHLHTISDFTRELHKFLVRWVFVHVVVSVLCVLKLDHEAVCMWILRRALVMVLVGHEHHTAWPSGLLFLPPEKDLI